MLTVNGPSQSCSSYHTQVSSLSFLDVLALAVNIPQGHLVNSVMQLCSLEFCVSVCVTLTYLNANVVCIIRVCAYL